MNSDIWRKPTDPEQPEQPEQPPQEGYRPPGYVAPGQSQQPGYQPPTGQPAYEPGQYQPPAPQYNQPGQYQPPATPQYGQPGAYQPPQAPPSNPYQQPAAYGAPYQQAPQPYPGTPYPSLPVAGQLASWGTRALGGLIDYVAPAFVFGILASPFAPGVNPNTGAISGGNQALYYLINTVLPIAFWVYNSGWKQGTTGKTFGKQVAKTRLISEATGQPIGFGLAVVRHLCHLIDSVICLVGWLFPLWDPKRQTIADKIMKTVVVLDA